MNREMCKKGRQLSDEETRLIFSNGHHGILSVNGDDGYPYAVPINYVYLNDAIYIHSAKYGYKIDAIKNNNKVCFTSILNSEIVPNRFTAKFESVIAFGRINIIENMEEKQLVMETFINRFSPDFKENGLKFINGAINKTEVLKIDIEDIKGKAYRDGKW